MYPLLACVHRQTSSLFNRQQADFSINRAYCLGLLCTAGACVEPCRKQSREFSPVIFTERDRRSVVSWWSGVSSTAAARVNDGTLNVWKQLCGKILHKCTSAVDLG